MTEFRPRSDTGRFFDWASTAPLSDAAMKAMSDFDLRQQLSSCPPDFVSSETSSLNALRDSLRRLLKPGPDALVVLLRSVAEAVSMLAHGLTLPPGGSVVVTAADHEAAVLPWLHRDRDAVRTVPCEPSGVLDLTEAERLIDGTTAVVSISHVSHLDGIVQPVRELAKITRERSAALLVVDGAQAVGRLPVEIAGLDADIYLGAGRKALLSPLGTGFLIASEAVLGRIRPSLLVNPQCGTRAERRGLGTAADVLRSDAPAGGEPTDLRCLAGLHGSVQAYLASDPQELARRTTGLLELLHAEAGRARLTALLPEQAENAGIVRLCAAGVDHFRLKRFLRSRGFALAATTAWLRISLLSFNDGAGVRALFNAVREAQ
jgi:selenocysteine lyase/cysteine desulfurase